MFTKFCIHFTLVGIIFLSKLKQNTAIRDKTWPYDHTTPFSYKTNSPVNIETKTAKVLQLTPLIVTVDESEPFKATNTGHTVELTLPKVKTTSHMTGGPLFKDIYYLHNVRIFWSQDPEYRCCATVDRETNSPIEGILAYYNSKYGTFNNSLLYRDGIALLQIRLNVQGHIPDDNFTAFHDVLEKITVEGSSVMTNHSVGTNPYSSALGATTFYYAYPASYMDVDHGTVYYCATLFVLQTNVAGSISFDQFEIFSKLRTSTGHPLFTQLVTFPQDDRPLIQATGFVVKRS